MNKIIILFLVIITSFFYTNSFTQTFTPPKVILGISFDGNFATNDAHGTNVVEQTLYGMLWGKGATVEAKYSLGSRLRHRIIASVSYNKMINNTLRNKIPFFVGIPDDATPYTNNDIWTGALGYEYAFNPRCRSKQFIGFAVTGNYLTSSDKSYFPFDPAFRVGLQFSTGYEFVTDRSFKTGISLGLKYNLMNIVGISNGVHNLNDGSDDGGAGYWRRIGMLTINIGFNFYLGVKPYRP